MLCVSMPSPIMFLSFLRLPCILQKFLDSSKLKRHYLIHTGERDFICPYEGCGKVIILSSVSKFMPSI